MSTKEATIESTKMIVYAVPDLKKAYGGPKTRIQQISQQAQKEYGAPFINGGAYEKIVATLKCGRVNLAYIESATNRISIADFVSLILLRIKSRKLVVYIRDIYIELFPQEYARGRKAVTKWFNRVSNLFYSIIADSLAFPTLEMGTCFFELNPMYRKRPYFALPPAAVILEEVTDAGYTVNKRLERISIAYIGSVTYKNAGIDNFLQFANLYVEKYTFYILTPDQEIFEMLENKYPALKGRVIVKSFKYKDMVKFIVQEKITFSFHTRPRNDYDDLTYPIKIMDYVSLVLPVITLPHKPIVDLFGAEYPLFLNDLSNCQSIDALIEEYSSEKRYETLVNAIKQVGAMNTYSIRIKSLISNAG